MRSASSHDRVVEEHLVEHAPRPVISRSGRMVTPGWSSGNANHEMPRVLRHVEVGAGEQHAVVGLACAMLLHTFWPVMTQWSPSRTARVVSPARSEPAPGSLNSWHHATAPSRIGGTSRAIWSGGAVREDRGRGHEQPEPAGRPERAVDARTPRGRGRPRRRCSPRPPCSTREVRRGPARRRRRCATTRRPARSGSQCSSSQRDDLGARARVVVGRRRRGVGHVRSSPCRAARGSCRA